MSVCIKGFHFKVAVFNSLLNYEWPSQNEVGNSGILVTARKRSFGQGNVFTLVCHSVHRGRGSAQPPRMQTPRIGQTPWMQTPHGWADPPGCRPPWMQTPRVGQTPLPGCRPPRGWADTPPYSQQAGGTHPTGIHTCIVMSL